MRSDKVKTSRIMAALTRKHQSTPDTGNSQNLRWRLWSIGISWKSHDLCRHDDARNAIHAMNVISELPDPGLSGLSSTNAC